MFFRIWMRTFILITRRQRQGPIACTNSTFVKMFNGFAFEKTFSPHFVVNAFWSCWNLARENETKSIIFLGFDWMQSIQNTNKFWRKHLSAKTTHYFKRKRILFRKLFELMCLYQRSSTDRFFLNFKRWLQTRVDFPRPTKRLIRKWNELMSWRIFFDKTEEKQIVCWKNISTTKWILQWSLLFDWSNKKTYFWFRWSKCSFYPSFFALVQCSTHAVESIEWRLLLELDQLFHESIPMRKLSSPTTPPSTKNIIIHNKSL